MEYPPKLLLKQLLAEHPSYTAMKPHLERISLLSEGGWRLRDKLSLFIEQRPGEEDPIYEARLKKFAYSNTLGSNLSQLASKITSGTVHVSNAASEDFWEKFREDNDGQGRTEIQLVEQIFAEALKFKTVFLHVDKTAAPVPPQSKAEEEQMGLRSKIVVYPAPQVSLWSESNGQLDWIKVFQIVDVINPLTEPMKMARWTFIDREHIARYEAYVKLDRKGNILELLDKDGNPLVHESEPAVPSAGNPVAHGFGALPVARLELDESQWSGNQAYAKGEECLRLECHRYDLLTASYLQRTYKPIQTPDSDLGDTYVGSDEPLPTGLQYVLQVDKFEWSEPKGDILVHVDKALTQAEKQIRAILGVGGAYVQEAIEASGVSKEMDFQIENDRLKSYGHILTDALQDTYQLVERAEGNSGSTLAVSGLDDFGGDRLTDLIEALNMLLGIDMARLQAVLTPTLYILIRERLLSLLMSNLTPEQKQAVLDEVADAPPPEPIPQPVEPAPTNGVI
ncbi:hypothetical protein VB780_03395 [Leptolyngbya sp. CCNP1308]|uniref:hypothetical protein n=1 Tax=Leptolyngbya sp. CCNP1308 TaxID=3110255 RepID=UPI002B21C4D0|nr:hypothetical protein [Leptolyngbya sp. CCNP1308]MEA5447599.1 hypothetical protein [Leptolyngbya sp. CCNP1308]